MGSKQVGMGMGMGPGSDWMATFGGLMCGHSGLPSPSTSARFPVAGTSQALAVCVSNSRFLIAGALQLHQWAFSSLLQPFQELGSRNVPKQQQVPGAIGEGCLHVPLETNAGYLRLTEAGAQFLVSGISLPWNSIIRFVEGKAKSGRRNSVAAGASAGGEDGSTSVTRGSGFGFGSRSRIWTNIILGANLLVFGAQIASQGQLLVLGAKVNSLIDKGQWWRLITYSLLHADILHLLVNSYSLNSVGPTVESLGGGKRFLAVYVFSALASSGLSYTFCTAPSVGASGAIFGLVGALAVFLARHRSLMTGGDQSLAQVGRIIAINLGFGLLYSKVDNWGHVGGLLGGAAVAWLFGPALSIELAPEVGKKFLMDSPPIVKLLSPWLKHKGDS